MSNNNATHRKIFTLTGVTLLIGVILRVWVASHFQIRVWIDEVWVVLSPAYHLLTGVSAFNEEWSQGIRDWIPPLLFKAILKFLHAAGLSRGSSALFGVRILIAGAQTASILYFCQYLIGRMRISRHAWLLFFVLLLTPELIHFASSADLSVIALPFLLFGIVFFDADEKRGNCNSKVHLGAALLSFSALIRFQFALFPLCFLIFLIAKKKFKKAMHLTSIGIGFILLDLYVNHFMTGQMLFPMYRYFTLNTVGGLASSYGVTPFYFGFELLWKFVTEPVFILAALFSFFTYKKMPALVCASLVFYLLHLSVGHKEYRFFYGSAVLFAAIGTAGFLSANLNSKWIASFFILFLCVAGFRTVKKIDWHSFEIPSKLETLAGEQKDVRGLITVGWGGIYQGANYFFHQPLPYLFAENKNQLISKQANPALYSHLIVPAHEIAPCAKMIQEERGGKLYACDFAEIKRYLTP